MISTICIDFLFVYFFLYKLLNNPINCYYSWSNVSQFNTIIIILPYWFKCFTIGNILLYIHLVMFNRNLRRCTWWLSELWSFLFFIFSLFGIFILVYLDLCRPSFRIVQHFCWIIDILWIIMIRWVSITFAHGAGRINLYALFVSLL